MLIWEKLKCETREKGLFSQSAPIVQRAKVPGGWFIRTTELTQGGGAFFYPDPEHLWDGSSLP